MSGATDCVRLHVLSLGAGVQSTTMALMAAHGEITPMPAAAIFADTGDEPSWVYETVGWLRGANVLPFPVIVTREGHLSERLFAGDAAARIPSFVAGGGIARRQCTRNFKIRPIRREVRALLGIGPRGGVPAGTVSQWIGISRDECWRIKPSGVAFIINRHPLIELGMSRTECEAWLRARGYPVPRGSACVYCPFLNNTQRRAIRDADPAGHRKAIEVDRRLRTSENVRRFHGETFVHSSRRPLADVDLSSAEERGQLNLFINECEGMCGV